MLLKETLWLRLLGLTRIPMLLYLGPRVLQLDDEGCTVKIPLGLRSRNHMGSMYVGALVTGADLAVGLITARAGRLRHPRVTFIFKDMRCDFLRRADGDVLFRCDQGRLITEAMAQADRTGERLTLPVEVSASVAGREGETAARFQMALSLKRK